MIKDKFLRSLIIIILLLIIIFLLNNLKGFLNPIFEIFKMLIIPIIISLFLYYAIRPVVRRLEKAKVHRGLMVLVVLLTFAILLGGFITYGGTVLKEQFEGEFLQSLSDDIDIRGFLDGFLDFVPEDILPEDINPTNQILNSLREFLLSASSNVIDLVGKVGDIGAQIILIPFILFYLLKDDREFFKAFMSIMPKKYNKSIEKSLRDVDRVLSTYISSQLLVSFILGIIMYVGYLIIRLPNALLMGFFAMITSVIPFIGPFLGALPAVLIAITIDFQMILKVVILAIVVQQIEGDLITPKVVGNKFKLHPLAVIIIILVSVQLFGIFGAFIGVPVYLILNILVKSIKDIWTDKRSEKFG